MPARKTKRQLADEAYLRNQQTLIATEEVLMPQDYPVLTGVPKACPDCHRSWSALIGINPLRTKDDRQSTFLEQAQCHGCGNIYLIPPEDHAQIVTARAEHEAARLAKKKAEEQAIELKKEQRRNKGAN